jgi:hypothetical protein
MVIILFHFNQVVNMDVQIIVFHVQAIIHVLNAKLVIHCTLIMEMGFNVFYVYLLVDNVQQINQDYAYPVELDFIYQGQVVYHVALIVKLVHH